VFVTGIATGVAMQHPYLHEYSFTLTPVARFCYWGLYLYGSTAVDPYGKHSELDSTLTIHPHTKVMLIENV